ncbi:MAG: DUF2752 domain-containing protein [Planctomycetes bacterium]|nr:DUF2752 domain-containing protein [Planctomycetota bacterium]MBL7009140.1 DUF2752 domain-containing protein [Planctomycetota bacterium]
MSLHSAPGPATSRLRLLAGLAVFLALAALLEPLAGGVRLFGWTLPELCPFARLGGPCPGCGATRATLSLARGDWRAAWASQPAVFLFLGAVLAPHLPVRPERGRRLASCLALAGAAGSILHFLQS